MFTPRRLPGWSTQKVILHKCCKPYLSEVEDKAVCIDADDRELWDAACLLNSAACGAVVDVDAPQPYTFNMKDTARRFGSCFWSLFCYFYDTRGNAC